LSNHISVSGQAASSSRVPLVAMDDNGNAIICWTQSDGSFDQLYKSEYRNGSWVHPTSLSNDFTDASDNVDDSDLVMDDDGNALIAWVGPGGGNNQIFKAEYRNGSWTYPSSESDNVSPDTQGAAHPAVAMDNNGNAIITWDQKDDPSGKTQIFKSEYRNSSWTNPSGLSDNISPDGQNASSPQVGMDDLGNAIIAWKQATTTKEKVFRSTYRNSTWTNPSSLSDFISFSDSDGANVQLAMDTLGNAILLWEQNDGVALRNYVSEFRISTGQWVNPSSISDSFSGNGAQGNASRVSMNNLGDGIVVWKN
jgi:mRNA-degrading endonuclease HigB of HigAB toxin-antitoxin module